MKPRNTLSKSALFNQDDRWAEVKVKTPGKMRYLQDTAEPELHWEVFESREGPDIFIN